MNSGKIRKSEELCISAIDTAVKRLCEIGVWPRPFAARNLVIGHDFSYGEFLNLEQIDDFIKYLANDGDIQENYFSKDESVDKQLWILYEYWLQLLVGILSETKGRTVNRKTFKKWFNKFINELYTDTAVWRALDTLIGVELEIDKIKFDDETILAQFSRSDLENYICDQSQFVLKEWLSLESDRAIVVTTIKIHKSKYAGLNHPTGKFLKNIGNSIAIRDAIRLIKPGVPMLHCHAVVHLSDFPLMDPIAYYDRDNILTDEESSAKVEKADSKQIQSLWFEIVQRYGVGAPFNEKLPKIDIALERLSQTYRSRSWIEDIVDLTIALEALFGPGDTQELQHRLALRVAWLLGTDKEHAQDSSSVSESIYEKIHTMYKIRSRMVHGGEPTLRDLEKWERKLAGAPKNSDTEYGKFVYAAVEAARDIVRRAILACMKLEKYTGSGPCWPLPSNFDVNIVIPKQRRIWQKAAGIR